MNENTRLEVAVEILAETIAIYSRKGYSVDSQEMQSLLHERESLYKGDKEVIEKILNQYAPIIKKKYESAGKKQDDDELEL